MSENQSRRNNAFSKYDAMTTEALEQILRSHAEAPEGQASDGELLLYIMEVLAKRKQNSEDPGITALEAWESFQQHYLPEEEDRTSDIRKGPKPARSFDPWMRRLTAAAAVAVLVVCLSATANAFGWTDIWNAVAKWAKETFSFVAGDNVQETEPATEDVRQYTSLQDALAQLGQEYSFLPTWIPEEYELKDITTDETPVRKTYIAFYSNGQKTIRINVLSYIDTDPEKVEINEDLIEVYEASEIEYYIFSNMEQKKVVWIRDSYECYISGDLTIEEIKKMIDSIGKG